MDLIMVEPSEVPGQGSQSGDRSGSADEDSVP